jgi:WD40 repeat protein
MGQPRAGDVARTTDESARLEEIVEGFEGAWQAGPRPDLDAYLPAAGPLRRAVLVELAHADLECRLKVGEPARAEDYLRRYPELADAPDLALDLIRSEYELRCPREGALPLEEYARRFPRYGDSLRRRWRAWARRSSLPGATTAVSPAPSAAVSPEAPSIPGYELLGVLGRGGMGVVYKARDTRLGRVVALKTLRAGPHAGEDELARFRAEAEAVAQIQHPNIVQVYEVSDAGGLPFFALEYVEGGSLAGRLAGTPWPARQAAVLVEALARALQAAHERGIVHRDATPANVLLAADGTPKWTDFGLAKRLDANVGRTHSGAILGTPSYLSPEAAAGRSKEVGPAADVYGAGGILYELLTGRPPFRAETVFDTLQQVLEQEPVPPVRLNPKVPRDLETVCLKCLAKEPGRRYPSAAALADDLRRFLEARPIAARPVGAWERGWKWARRRPAAAGLVGLGAVTLAALAALTAGLFSAARLEAERNQAQAARADADQARAEVARQKREVEQQRDLVRRYSYAAHTNLAASAWREGNLTQMLSLLEDQQPERTGGEDLRGFEWFYLWRLAHPNLLTLPGPRGERNCVCFSPDGTRLASASMDGKAVKVWDAATGHEDLTLNGHTGAINSVSFSSDGKRLASGSDDATVRVWDARTGQQQLLLKGHHAAVACVAFSPDGSHLASASDDRTVKVWGPATATEVLTFGGHSGEVYSVAFGPDGRRLASASTDGTVKVWDAASGKQALTIPGPRGFPWSVGFSPDGRRLACARLVDIPPDDAAKWHGEVKVWDAQTGQEQLTFQGHRVVFSRDGRRLAGASTGGTVKVWDAQTGQEQRTLQGHNGIVNSVCFSPDGRRVASSSTDGSVKVWEAPSGQEDLLVGHTQGVSAVSFSPDGARLASASLDGMVRVWEAATAQEALTLRGHAGAVRSVSFSPDGTRLASAAAERTVKVWDAKTGREVLSCKGHTGSVSHVSWGPDGKRLASAGWDRTVKLWDAGTGREVFTLRGHTTWVNAVSFSPDGTRLASASADGRVTVWDATAGREILTFRGHTASVSAVAFGPDGTRLATASAAGTVKVWEAATGQELLTLRGHTGTVAAVSFSSDGERLASAGEDRMVKVWDARTGREVLNLTGHTAAATSVAFSPDGKRLASASEDQTVRVWDTQAGREMSTRQAEISGR